MRAVLESILNRIATFEDTGSQPKRYRSRVAGIIWTQSEDRELVKLRAEQIGDAIKEFVLRELDANP